MDITNRSRASLISMSRWGRIIGILSIFNVCLFLYYAFSQGLITEDGGKISISSFISVPFHPYLSPLFVLLFFLVPAILLTASSIKLYNVSYHEQFDDMSNGLKLLRLHFQYCFIANCIAMTMFWASTFYLIYWVNQFQNSFTPIH